MSSKVQESLSRESRVISNNRARELNASTADPGVTSALELDPSVEHNAISGGDRNLSAEGHWDRRSVGKRRENISAAYLKAARFRRTQMQLQSTPHWLLGPRNEYYPPSPRSERRRWIPDAEVAREREIVVMGERSHEDKRDGAPAIAGGTTIGVRGEARRSFSLQTAKSWRVVIMIQHEAFGLREEEHVIGERRE
ncbi:hypothetical protein B0H19DRAFT_1081570 [Mycena capillaripes]|nr:hypothetical protein B0H19DRAFT_1081570 [Mycena capillaripes]